MISWPPCPPSTPHRSLDRLAHALVALNRFRRDSPATVMAACANVFSFALSLCCPECRASIADELRQHIPQILADADALAATDEHRHDH